VSVVSESVIVRGREVRASDVRRAVQLCDDMGEAAFLAEFGYGRAIRWHLRVNGKSYPSKAILGVAAGLKHTEHFGGAAHAINALTQLGFTVRNSETGSYVEPDGLERHRAEAERFYREACAEKGTKVPFPVWPELPVIPSSYFASGSNTPAHIKGMADSQWDVGVAAPRVTGPSEKVLASLAGSEVEVFVDSGAFREVDFGPEGPVVTHPMSEDDWAKVLGLYGRLAPALGSQLYVVAPDQVGSQDVTLERLERWASEVKALIASGARVLVAMQKQAGGVSQAEFAELVDSVLGDGWVPAFPCNKGATTPEEVAAFLAARKPGHVHLLGVGVWSKEASSYLEKFVGVECSVSMDSAWVPAKTGKGSSRIYTIAKGACKKALEAAGFAGRALTHAYNVLGIMVCCGHPTPVLSGEEAKALEPGLPWAGGSAAEVA